MKTLLLLALTMAFGLLQTHGDLLDFRKMIRLVTGKEAMSSYSFYGCHCGLGGKGSPKDATDRCCATHDCCYYRLQKRGCRTKSLSYKFAYRKGQITCGRCSGRGFIRKHLGSSCTGRKPHPEAEISHPLDFRVRWRRKS
ncbi:phospholipase A2, membrane associated isoform X2 [Desmodus rotundus]|uniref:phospholipase A2, membrane associated isoform X2 n=1 Tax=Desmodus rotundus TaxID=9430 RepID=UPI00238111A9|nr:phospholipase A2, membrane associated isoform X2 [Desmodus rotundus]